MRPDSNNNLRQRIYACVLPFVNTGAKWYSHHVGNIDHNMREALKTELSLILAEFQLRNTDMLGPDDAMRLMGGDNVQDLIHFDEHARISRKLVQDKKFGSIANIFAMNLLHLRSEVRKELKRQKIHGMEPLCLFPNVQRGDTVTDYVFHFSVVFQFSHVGASREDPFFRFSHLRAALEEAGYDSIDEGRIMEGLKKVLSRPPLEHVELGGRKADDGEDIEI